MQESLRVFASSPLAGDSDAGLLEGSRRRPRVIERCVGAFDDSSLSSDAHVLHIEKILQLTNTLKKDQRMHVQQITLRKGCVEQLMLPTKERRTPLQSI